MRGRDRALGRRDPPPPCLLAPLGITSYCPCDCQLQARGREAGPHAIGLGITAHQQQSLNFMCLHL